MSKHYSTKNFFRQMPNALLARYFQARGLLGNVDFTKLKETRPDPLFNAWLALPAAARNTMDAEFREIFELANEKGLRAILDEAEWHLNDPAKFTSFVDKLSALANHYERAMQTFLDHKSYWKGARLFHHADSLPHWRKRKNLPRKDASVDAASLLELADLIRNYFHHTEGRGKNCVVEPFRRGDLDYFFAYPEDYSQQAVEWVNGQFGRRPHNPAFEVIFVYSKKEGSLDLNYRGANKAIEPLQGMFVSAILKEKEIPHDPKDTRVYDLNPLQKKNFNFVFQAGSGIQDVRVKKLRLSSKLKSGDRITLEADPTHNRDAVPELLADVGKSISLANYSVTQVELAATLVVDAGKPPKTVSIRITHPNSCSLKYDERDLKLRDMLHDSAIEPKAPPDKATSATPATDAQQNNTA